MSDLQKIRTVLDRAARHRRWSRAWNGLLWGVFAASAIWLLALVAFKLLPVPFAALCAIGLGACGLMPVGFVWGWWKKDSPLDTAKWVDNELALKERLSAAIEFQSSESWGGVLLREGARSVSRASLGSVLQYRLPRVARWTVLLLFVGVTLGFVPEYRSQRMLDERKQAEIIKDAGTRLEHHAKTVLQYREPALKPTEQAMRSVEELGADLQKIKLTRADALERISNVTDRLKEQARSLENPEAFRRIRQASRSATGATGGDAELQRKIDRLQERMGGNSADLDALKALKKRLDQLRGSAADMPTGEAGTTPDLSQQMGADLANLMQLSQDQGLSLPDLDLAMAAFQQGEYDRVAEMLDSAQIDLEKMLEMAKALHRMQTQQEQAGRDLGEQLEKGQVSTAYQNLQEMIRKMREGTDGEEIRKILQEVSEALDPAGGYGQCQALLRQALQQGETGNRQASAESLQQAAEELKRLMEEYGDMQSLLDTLKACEIAQQSVGNCQGWGACQGGGTGNGLSSRGVGTWADGNQMWKDFDPDLAQRWDNSGIQRPDMESRGHTDRGQGPGTEGMIPTKVRGKFTPGGPMPSITLRGVNLKGESRVQVEEAISAAQQEAQSALNQEKIPRAFQRGVRDYFDDFN